MPTAQRLQGRRFEFKYIIGEARARAILNFARCHLEPDENNHPKGGGYPVHSLYLDSANLILCDSVVAGLKNRFKLRIRFYDDSPVSPVFFEIKRRDNDVIFKQRAAVRRSSAGRLLVGHSPRFSDLVKENPKEFAGLHRFCELRDRLQARGQVLVSYMREAYVSPHDDDVRLTIDHHLMGRKEDRSLSLEGGGLTPTPFQGVVLELKFTDRFPEWMRELVREFNLRRCSMGKYLECARSMVLEPKPMALRGGPRKAALPPTSSYRSSRSAVGTVGF